MVYFAEYPSPVGVLLLTTDGSSLTGLYMDREPPEGARENCRHPILAGAASWLDGYFWGEPQPVSIPLEPGGTPFQRKVWKLLEGIPCGSTVTYGELARQLGETMSAQAVGGAVGRNPISILVPCHRVVGVGGKLTGYAYGLERKKWLLEHEKGRER